MPDIGGRRLSNADTTLGVALVVALIAIFLPWYSASYNCGGVPGCAGFNTSASVGGLSYWSGWLFFIATLAGLALFIIRTFVPTVTLPDMRRSDADLYVALGAFMVLMAVLWWVLGAGSATVSGPGYSAGASFGLFIGLIAAIAVAVGGYMKRSDPGTAQRLPVSSTTTYGGPPTSSPPPPPPM